MNSSYPWKHIYARAFDASALLTVKDRPNSLFHLGRATTPAEQCHKSTTALKKSLRPSAAPRFQDNYLPANDSPAPLSPAAPAKIDPCEKWPLEGAGGMR